MALLSARAKKERLSSLLRLHSDCDALPGSYQRPGRSERPPWWETKVARVAATRGLLDAVNLELDALIERNLE